MNCLYCGKEFKPDRKTHKFCSEKCQRKYRDQNHSDLESEREWERKAAQNLNKRYVKRLIYLLSGGSIKFKDITEGMIEAKRKAILELRFKRENHLLKRDRIIKGPYKCKCIICGIDFISTMSFANVCSKKCNNRKFANRIRLKYNPKPKKELKCKVCGQIFLSSKKQGLCSYKCRNKYRDRNHSDRARKFGCQHEYVNPIKVFIRDGWKCQLCGKQLRKKDRGKFIDLAPELDHIIPLSKGGAHSYLNTQCACRKCNGDKNDNNIGQLRMFG